MSEKDLPIFNNFEPEQLLLKAKLKALQNELDNLDERLDYLVSHNKINESTEKSYRCIIRGKRKILFNLISKKMLDMKINNLIKTFFLKGKHSTNP